MAGAFALAMLWPIGARAMDSKPKENASRTGYVLPLPPIRHLDSMRSAELPGMTEKDVQVEIANGILTIRGEKKAERNGEGKYVTERYGVSFQRQIPLEDVQEERPRHRSKMAS